MQKDLELYIRRLARQQGLALSELARRAGMSRQALYGIWKPGHHPSVGTLIRIARVLEVHPLGLLQLLFREEPGAAYETGESADPAQVNSGTDGSAFIRDDNYPDGSQVLAGQSFRKAWTIQNVGEQVWEDRFLACQDRQVQFVAIDAGREVPVAQSLIPEQPRVPIPTTYPGQTVTVEVGFTAPSAPSTVISYWKMTYEDGRLCFTESRGIWVQVSVVTPFGAAVNRGDAATLIKSPHQRPQ
ncbi:NBR1-Ig-like domain-containing protein [Halorhodospira abdelmalekii]|uniref:NBR1-Ig-like domain-containing protein n=1 Tax=Halorhodospira abdelmalekii TaxID=421629 RepID=UPI0019065FDE|nr:NBR1-Ig-like domain-containing protein [Halorhodospira abdelmalekii]